jgi:hypothetical protein
MLENEIEVDQIEKYVVSDELNFVAWIASNGLTDSKGMIKNDLEIECDGLPRKVRTCLERIDFLRKYAEGWKTRNLPEDWTELHRKIIVGYIYTIAIPTVESLREIQLGDLV